MRAAAHACRCSGCDPSLRLEGPRLGEHHIGTRFGDANHGWRVIFGTSCPINVASMAIEAVAGEGGWVQMPVRTPPVHLCQCGSYEPCSRRYHGPVRVSLRRSHPEAITA